LTITARRRYGLDMGANYLSPEEENKCRLGMSRFKSAHDDEPWNITCGKGQSGFALSVAGPHARCSGMVPVLPTLDLADSVFEALEGFRSRNI